MQRPSLLRALALSLLLLLVGLKSLEAEIPSNVGILKVHVLGIKTTNGKIVVNVFRKNDDLFGKPYLKRDAAITQTHATLQFPDLHFGDYVVFAFHDENNNDRLDHNWLHLPMEPMGYSNDWHFGLLTGMPTFEKTKFVFSNTNSAVTITLR